MLSLAVMRPFFVFKPMVFMQTCLSERVIIIGLALRYRLVLQSFFQKVENSLLFSFLITCRLAGFVYLEFINKLSET